MISDPIRLSLRTLLVFLLLAAIGCKSTPSVSENSSESDVPVLRVGVTANMPPFVFEQAGKLVGLEIDFAIALAEELGRKVRFVQKDWEDLIPALRKNEIDIIMAGMNYNPERASIIAFSNPYVRSGQMAMVLQKNASKYPVPGFIYNTSGKVGAESGTTGAFLVRGNFPKATLKTYSSAQKGAEAVIREEIEMFILDAPTGFWFAGIYQNRGLTMARAVLSEDLMVWGINGQNIALLSAVNSILAEWNSSGAIDAVLSRWVRM